jgi:glycerol-3-phosphate acyltransferase PlsY
MMFFGLITVLGFFYGIASPNFRRDKEVAIFAIVVFMLHQIIFVLMVEDPTIYVIGIAIFALYSSITAFSLINVYFVDDDERYTEQDLNWADLIVFIVFLSNIATIAIAKMGQQSFIEE